MKKISLFAVALYSSLALFAQNYEKPTKMAVATRLGIKAGMNLAEFLRKDYPGTAPVDDRISGLNGGLFLNVPLGTGGVAVQPELIYHVAGSKITQTTQAGSVTVTNHYKQNLGYLALPVMLQWKSAGGFILETGPQAGYLIHAEQNGPGENSSDNKGDFEKLDVAWNGGIGYLSRIGLGIGARYSYGLRDIADESLNVPGKTKNSVISFDLSWTFGAGK